METGKTKLAFGDFVGLRVKLRAVKGAGRNANSAAVTAVWINFDDAVMPFGKSSLGADPEAFRTVTVIAGHGKKGMGGGFGDFAQADLAGALIFTDTG